MVMITIIIKNINGKSNDDTNKEWNTANTDNNNNNNCKRNNNDYDNDHD